tara:strand:+ start:521 stop:1522 length:1002 start_codon:yes stop_codon:yes gene_type:complete
MKVISLFCGCGGMDLGLVKSGHTVIWANDIDKDSISTYRNYFIKKLKHKNTILYQEDIKKVNTKDIPKGDVVVGGFPCQGFSIANTFRNEKRAMETKNNVLYRQLIRIIKDKKPKYFIAENVKGILSLGGYKTELDKKNREGLVMKNILKEMRSIGYRVTWKVMNAADFGAPQNRHRVIFLGTRIDLKKEFVHPPSTHSLNGEDMFLQKTPTLWEAIGDLENKYGNPEIINSFGSQYRVKINNYIGNRKTIKNKPSPTIVGRGGGTGGPIIIPHPNGKRRLSVREVARLQCFPDDFEFMGSISSGYRQIGNAVAWPVANALGNQLNLLDFKNS